MSSGIRPLRDNACVASARPRQGMSLTCWNILTDQIRIYDEARASTSMTVLVLARRDRRRCRDQWSGQVRHPLRKCGS